MLILDEIVRFLYIYLLSEVACPLRRHYCLYRLFREGYLDGWCIGFSLAHGIQSSREIDCLFLKGKSPRPGSGTRVRWALGLASNRINVESARGGCLPPVREEGSAETHGSSLNYRGRKSCKTAIRIFCAKDSRTLKGMSQLPTLTAIQVLTPYRKTPSLRRR